MKVQLLLDEQPGWQSSENSQCKDRGRYGVSDGGGVREL